MQTHRTAAPSLAPQPATTARPVFRRVLTHCAKCHFDWTVVPDVAKPIVLDVPGHESLTVHQWECACQSGMAVVEVGGRKLTDHEAVVEFVKRGAR